MAEKLSRNPLGWSHAPTSAGPAVAEGGFQGGDRYAQLEALARRSARQTSHLAFVIDATSSRAASWEAARKIQRRMVDEACRFGSLRLRVIHFGGSCVGCFPNGWTQSADQIAQYMDGIVCRVGGTQIVPAIEVALSSAPPPDVIVVIGDTCEEPLEAVRTKAKELAGRSIPAFSFFDQPFAGDWRSTDAAHRLLAAETGGVFARFGDKLDLGSLMVATAAYVTGGEAALRRIAAQRTKEGQAALQLIEQLRLPPPSHR